MKGPGPKKTAAKDSTQLKGYTGVARKKYTMGMYGGMGFKDVGVKNNVVQLQSNKYPTTGGQQMVAKNLEKANPGMKFKLNYKKD